MNKDDYRAFCEVIGGFAELKGKQLSAPAIELYWEAMRGWPLAEFKRAAAVLLRQCEFFPTPADFEKIRRAKDLTPGEAWESVLHKRHDATPRAKRAAEIAANGRYLGHLNIETELPHVQRRFLEIYAQLSDAEETRLALGCDWAENDREMLEWLSR